MTKEQLLDDLKAKSETASFLERMNLQDEIFDLEVELGIREPRNFNTEGNIECIGCGS